MKKKKKDMEALEARLLTVKDSRPGPFATTHILVFPNGQEMQVDLNTNNRHFMFHMKNESVHGRTIYFSSKDFRILHQFRLRRAFDFVVKAKRVANALYASSTDNMQKQNSMQTSVLQK